MAGMATMLRRQLADIAGDPPETDLKVLLRHAKRRAHPDVEGGSVEAMQEVHRLEGMLRDFRAL